MILLYTLVIFYGLWLVLTLIRAAGYPALARLRVPRPVWSLLPNWSLFAPRPGMTDHYVMYRDQVGDGEPGPWLVAHAPEPRTWFHGLSYPDKIQAKAVFDLVQQLAHAIGSMQPGGEATLMQSVPYQHLLHFVRHLPRHGPAEYRQFSIVLREPANHYEATLIVSPFYSL